MKLLPILFAFTKAKKKGAKETTECGCNAATVASSYISGSGTATCTAEGKKGRKGEGLFLHFRTHFLSRSFRLVLVHAKKKLSGKS